MTTFPNDELFPSKGVRESRVLQLSKKCVLALKRRVVFDKKSQLPPFGHKKSNNFPAKIYEKDSNLKENL